MIVIHGDNDNNNAYDDDDDVDAYASFCDCLN